LTLGLRAGHKIGKPLPLFTKIEQKTIDDLKIKYAGEQSPTQQQQQPQKKEQQVKQEPKSFSSAAEIEKAIEEQGNKVRILKKEGNKNIWQPEVAILLSLKKQLEAFKSKA
jgi:methionyl-tRNA synthetase